MTYLRIGLFAVVVVTHFMTTQSGFLGINTRAEAAVAQTKPPINMKTENAIAVAKVPKAKANFFGAKYRNMGKEDESQAEQEDKSQVVPSKDWIDVNFMDEETEDALAQETKEDAKSPAIAANPNTQDWFDIDVTPWAGDTKANSTQGVKFVVKPQSKAMTSDNEEEVFENESENRSAESIEKEKFEMEKAESNFASSTEGVNSSVEAEKGGGEDALEDNKASEKDRIDELAEKDSSKAKQQGTPNTADALSKETPNTVAVAALPMDTNEKEESVEEVFAESLIAFPDVHVDVTNLSPAERPHPIETSLSQEGHPELANILAVTFKPGKLGIGADWKTGRVRKLTDKRGQGAHFSITPDMIFKSIDGEDYSERLLDKKVAGKQEYEVVFSVPSHEVHASESMLAVSDSGAFGKVSDSDYEDFADEFNEAEDQYDESANGHPHDAHEYDDHGTYDHDATDAGYDDHEMGDLPHDDYHGSGDAYDEDNGHDDHHHDFGDYY